MINTDFNTCRRKKSPQYTGTNTGMPIEFWTGHSVLTAPYTGFRHSNLERYNRTNNSIMTMMSCLDSTLPSISQMSRKQYQEKDSLVYDLRKEA